MITKTAEQETSTSPEFRIPSQSMRTMLGAVDFSRGHSGRYAMDGCMLDFHKGSCTAIATDGVSLATRTITLPVAREDECNVLLAPDAVSALLNSGKTAGAIRLSDYGHAIEWRQRNGVRTLRNNYSGLSFPRYSHLLDDARARWAGGKVEYWCRIKNEAPPARITDSVCLGENGALARPSAQLTILESGGEPPQIHFDLNKLIAWMGTLADLKNVEIVLEFAGSLEMIYGSAKSGKDVISEYLLMPCSVDR